jgi:hypothetical protein
MDQDEITISRDGTIRSSFPLNAPDLRRMAYFLVQLAETYEPISSSPTELDPIWGISPHECENPDAEELPHSVRAIVREIHRAAQQSRRAGSASMQTLLYIELKEKEGLGIRTREHRLKQALYHVKAMLMSTKTLEQKIVRIEQIAAVALDLPFEAEQS